MYTKNINRQKHQGGCNGIHENFLLTFLIHRENTVNHSIPTPTQYHRHVHVRPVHDNQSGRKVEGNYLKNNWNRLNGFTQAGMYNYKCIY